QEWQQRRQIDLLYLENLISRQFLNLESPSLQSLDGAFCEDFSSLPAARPDENLGLILPRAIGAGPAELDGAALDRDRLSLARSIRLDQVFLDGPSYLQLDVALKAGQVQR